MGVRLVNLEEGVELLAIDKNVEDQGEASAEAVAKGAVEGPASKTAAEETDSVDNGSDENGEE